MKTNSKKSILFYSIIIFAVNTVIPNCVFTQNISSDTDTKKFVSVASKEETEKKSSINETKTDYSGFKNAVVLDLSNCDFTEIPSSIFDLSNLESLILKNTNISSIPYDIKKLYQLKVLDLTNTNIDEVPYEIRYLNQLQELHLSYEKWQYKLDKVHKLTRAAIILE